MRRYVENIYRPWNEEWKDPLQDETAFETHEREFNLDDIEYEPEYALNHNPNRIESEEEIF